MRPPLRTAWPARVKCLALSCPAAEPDGPDGARWRGAPVFVCCALLLAVLAAPGCRISANNEAQELESLYATSWRSGVEPVNAGAAQMESCNVTKGDRDLCVDASSRMATQVQGLRDRISALKVPPRFVAGHNAIVPALSRLVDLLHEQVEAIQRHDSAGFVDVTRRMKTLASEISDASRLYPPDANISVDIQAQ